MKQNHLLSKHPRILPLAILAMILGPAIIYFVLRGAGLSAAVVSGVVLIVAAKHFGLLAVIVAPIYALARRRSVRRKPGLPDSTNREEQGTETSKCD